MLAASAPLDREVVEVAGDVASVPDRRARSAERQLRTSASVTARHPVRLGDLGSTDLPGVRC